MKKYLLGITAVILALGFSAFAPHKPTTTYLFYRTSGTSQSTARLDYQYKTSVFAGCNAQANTYCSANWDQSSAPSDGDHPLTSATIGTTFGGVYNGQ